MTKPTTSDRIWAFSRRLGAQAVLSATVMACLHMASINGYDIRDLLPTEADDAQDVSPMPTAPVRTAGVPPRFDLPVQAGGLLESLVPGTSVDIAAREPAGPPAPETKPLRLAIAVQPSRSVEAVVADKEPASLRVAVPTPRPAVAAAARPVAPSRHRAVPADLPFDTWRRDVAVYDVAELVDPDAIPEPLLAEDGGFAVGDLVPSGSALLHRTAAITGTAAHVVTGTASRLIDLVR